MNKRYNEPEFKVIVSATQNVITTSGETYNPGTFDTGAFGFNTNTP